jgi:hypothetical protein
MSRPLVFEMHDTNRKDRKMVKQSDLDAVFDALVENGLRFITRATADVQADTQLSVLHFATGLELVLKSRLFREHWTLIAEKPHGATWNKLRAGDLLTLSAKKLCETISAVTGESLKH